MHTRRWDNNTKSYIDFDRCANCKVTFKDKNQQVNNRERELFHSTSISGRYIYGYFCLMSVIKTLHLEPLPKILDEVLREFVETDMLDDWQDKIDGFLPSKVLDSKSSVGLSESSGSDFDTLITKYYLAQPEIVCNVLEDLIWLGMSNLYGKFNSDITLAYVIRITELLEAKQINLPDLRILENYPVTERNGWGNVMAFPNAPSQ